MRHPGVRRKSIAPAAGTLRSSDTGLAARSIAVELIGDVLDRDRGLDQALEAHGGDLDRLASRDRAFALNLASTTLRRLGQIDALLQDRLDHPLPVAAADVRHLLRVGVVQLAFLATPPHAVVSTAVALLARRQRRTVGFAPLVNAVLRRLAADAGARVAAQDAVRLNTPDWLWTTWISAYGEAATRQIAAAHLTPPPLDITAKADPADVARRLGARLLPTATVRLPTSTAVASLPGYAEGAWWVQDAAAALPARLFGPLSGRTVVDLCAAPGGKTAQLAAAGARVIAVDRSAARMRRLVANLDRLGLDAATVVADGVTWRPRVPVDAVLVDAPCTATGTIRRHPDIAHRKVAADLIGLTALQDRLLAAAVAMVRAGGEIVYGTCSLQPEEGPARIAALLASDARVSRRPIAAAEIAGLDALVTAEGDLRSFPYHLSELGGIDGFYAARLVRH